MTGLVLAYLFMGAVTLWSQYQWVRDSVGFEGIIAPAAAGVVAGAVTVLLLLPVPRAWRRADTGRRAVYLILTVVGVSVG